MMLYFSPLSVTDDSDKQRDRKHPFSFPQCRQLFVPARNTARARQQGSLIQNSEFADMEKFHTDSRSRSLDLQDLKADLRHTTKREGDTSVTVVIGFLAEEDSL